MTIPATTATFLDKTEALAVAAGIHGANHKTVIGCKVKRTDGCWIVIAHKADGTSAPVETSDVERMIEWVYKS